MAHTYKFPSFLLYKKDKTRLHCVPRPPPPARAAPRTPHAARRAPHAAPPPHPVPPLAFSPPYPRLVESLASLHLYGTERVQLSLAAMLPVALATGESPLGTGSKLSLESERRRAAAFTLAQPSPPSPTRRPR